MRRTSTPRAGAAPGALLACVLLLVGAVLLRPIPGQPARELLGNLAQTAAALLAAVQCFAARRRDAETAAAWRWAGWAATSWALGNLALIGLIFGLHQTSRPSVADLFFVVSSMTAVVAALRFPSAPDATASRLRIVLDGAITASALLFSGWVLLHWLLPPTVGDVQLVQAGYPLADMVIVVAVLAAVSRLPARQRLPLLTVALGVVGLAASNAAVFAMESRDAYVPGDRLDLGLVAGLCLIALGATSQRSEHSPRAISPALGRLQLLLPYLPVCLGITIGVIRLDSLSTAQLGTGVFMVGLVITRQVLLVVENDALIEEVARRARRVEAIIDGSNDITLLLDGSGNLTWASPSLAVHFPPAGQTLGQPVSPHWPDPDVFDSAFAQARRDGRSSSHVTFVAANGEPHEYELYLTDRMDDPLLQAMVVQARDVTARRAAERALEVSEERYRRIVEASSDGIWLVDANAITRFVNQRAAELVGLPAEEIINRPVLEVVGPFLNELQHDLTKHRVKERRNGPDTYEMKARRPDGTELYVWVSATPLYDAEGTYEGSLTMVADITARKQLEDELLIQATTDTLTGLVNRDTFLSTAATALAAKRRGQAAVLFCDLDGFKAVNDTYGHSTGDELLRIVGQRLAHCLSERDVLARLGGDEFAALLLDVNDEEAATAVADRLLASLGQPVKVAGRTLHVSGSIGISLAEAGKDVEQLLREADLAMYEAKGSGRGRSKLFAPSMHAALLHRMAIDLELREALSQSQFSLSFQPVLKLDDGAVAGFEALLRWIHPTRGVIKPDEFISATEDSGLIVPLGAWVIDEACRQAAAWLAAGHELQMGVNVAAPQLEAGTLPTVVREALTRHSLPPGKLVLEITERSLLAGDAARSSLSELHALGVHLALDDFGTGHSSLSHLRDFPVRIVKIDRSYVQRLAENERDARLARGLIDMAHGLGLDVVAEGIETAEQEHAVRSLGCVLGQGFRYAPGMPADEATAWLSSARLRRVPAPRPTTEAGVLEAQE